MSYLLEQLQIDYQLNEKLILKFDICANCADLPKLKVDVKA